MARRIMMSYKKAAFFLAILTMAFSPLIEGGTTHLPVFIIRILILLGCSFYLAASLKEGEFSFRKTPFDRAILIFLLLAGLSMAIAPYKSMAFTWGQVIFYYALFFYLATAVFSIERSEWVAIYAITGMAVAESVWAFAQRLHGVTRPSGSFFNPNMLAGYLAPALLIAVSFVIFRNGAAYSRSRKAVFVVVACTLAVAIIITGSRGALVSLGAGLFLVLWTRSKRLAVVSVSLVAAALLVLPNPVKERLSSGDIFAYSRADIWASTARMIADNPVGVGLGNFKYMATRYNFPVEDAVIRYGKIANNAHNEYLQIGAEMGIAGLAAFLYGIYLLARVIINALRLEGERKGLAAGISGGITAILIHALFDANFHEPGIFLLLVLLVCLLLKVGGFNRQAVSLHVEQGKRTRLALLSVLIVLTLVLWAGASPLAYYYSTRAGAEARSGNQGEALRNIDKALLFESGNAAYHSQRAAVLYKDYKSSGDEGLFGWSLDELAEATRLNPSEASYPLLKAKLLYERSLRPTASDERKKLLEEALKEVLASKRLNPYNYETYMTIARIYVSAGDRDAAIDALERLENLEPNYLRGRLMLAGLYLDAGKRGLSKKEYDNIILCRNNMAGRHLDKNEADFAGITKDELEGFKEALEK